MNRNTGTNDTRGEKTKHDNRIDSANMLQVTPLGAGNEVGRSCIIAAFRGKTIMLDCGIHPGYSGLMSLPFFDDIDLKSVDVILVTHFHLDHCAALPYVMSKTDFKGQVLMTHPTKAIYHTLMMDFVRLTKSSSAADGDSDTILYNEDDVNSTMDKIEVVDFHQTVTVSEMRITPHAAGHVLGACMFLVEIAGMRLLYTGDYSKTPDRHLAGAEVPNINPHCIIIESTYGVSSHRPREEREARFLSTIRSIVETGGRCLLPVVALGRAQELLLMLDEYWENNPDIRHVPIYQASGLAQRAMSVYQTYIEFMNESIRRAFQLSNPFVFKHVQHLKGPLDDTGACVVLATPSMLQSGLSRELFDSWCENPINGCIIADFAVQGTLAREILSEPKTVTTRQGLKVPLRCKVEAISFSAHADFPQTRDFLDATAPPHVVLVHGEVTEMGRLKRALEQKAVADGKQRNVHMPKNCQTIDMELAIEKRAKIVGQLAGEKVHDQKKIRGLLVRRGFSDTILDPSDLGTLTQLNTSRILQRQAIPTSRSLSNLRLDLEQLVDNVREDITKEMQICADETSPKSSIIVGERLRITHSYGPYTGKKAKKEEMKTNFIVLEWESSPSNDILADAIVAIVMKGEPPSTDIEKAEVIRETAKRDGNNAKVREMDLTIVENLFIAQFGNCKVNFETANIILDVDGVSVKINWDDETVESDDNSLKERVRIVIKRLRLALDSVMLE